MSAPAMYASCSAATRSYSARVTVCLVALVESSTMNVDLVLRESTRALTTTLPNSVTWLFGIFSVSSRSRSAVGFHSTDAALTPYTTAAPPPRARRRVAPLRAHPAIARRKRPAALRDLGSVPRRRELATGRTGDSPRGGRGKGTLGAGRNGHGARPAAVNPGSSDSRASPGRDWPI